MTAAKQQAKIYNIPTGIPFARAFAAQLITETKTAPETLADYTILLPTHRAVRILQQSFLDLTGGKPILLPRLHTLGDIDEEELSLRAAGDETPEEILDIPPALPPLKRRILLAKLIMGNPDYAKSFDQALLLAQALGTLIDHIHTEGLDIKNLATLAPDGFSEHWQITLDFMKIIAEHWPAFLAEQGMIDKADRRNRLLRAIAAHWKKSPPQTPVIAAGTTGSIPATAELLHTIIGLPQGRVILPGLDQDMDAASWHALDESHPQYLLKNLLHRFGQEREQIPLWPTTQNDTAKPRRLLATEIMRPPATTDQWAKTLPGDKLAQQNIKAALGNLHLLHCTNEREEATAIAILLRQSLTIPDQKAVLITPRRSLAHRVIAACRRWNITLDDSAGRALDQTEAGIFLRLSAEAIARDFSPVALLALLKHPRSKFKEQARALDLEIRGTRPAPEKLYEKITDKITPDLDPLMRRITNESRHTNLFKFNELLVMHLDLCEILSPTPDALWQNEDGEAAALFLTELKEYAPLLPEITKTEYCGILDTLLITIPVRSAFGGHPRLKILGQLEARMTDADLVIMAGLNEKTWPPDPGFDPWMSRPMRKEFGLPAAERSIGLAAHDFIQGFCAPNTVITRSERQDGAPTVPARWLQRLTAVLEAAGIDKNTILSSPAIHWANALDETTPAPPLRRPEPRPPLNARPQKISVTQVEKWQKDPYSIYARHILKLTILDALEKPIDAAETGDLLHKILKNFNDRFPAAIPKDAENILKNIAEEELKNRRDDPAAWAFWKHRFEKTALWLTEHERNWRKNARYLKGEINGEIKINTPNLPFLLHGRADRIDEREGGGVIIDYKSGGTYPASQIKSGELPQLALEALILQKGGFALLGPLKPISLQYWKLTGGNKPGETTEISGNIEDIIAECEQGLNNLIESFNDINTPYYSLPRPDKAPRFNDYKHLARIAEWTALSEDDSTQEAA